jgi:hypothetical protein
MEEVRTGQRIWEAVPGEGQCPQELRTNQTNRLLLLYLRPQRPEEKEAETVDTRRKTTSNPWAMEPRHRRNPETGRDGEKAKR